MNYGGLLIFISILFLSCEKDQNSRTTPDAHLEYFGFSIVDTYWDDPTDSETKTNYADEIHHFCNIADILILEPDDDIVERTTVFTNLELKPILHLNELFFVLVDTLSASGSNFDLRTDFEERWNEFKLINQEILTPTSIAAFYIGEEPTWNGISFTELSAVSELLQSDFPDIPTMIIEAYPSLDDLRIPEAIDWVGFDQYFIKDPNTNDEFQENWQKLHRKLSDPSQRIMVILDSHYIDWAHGDYGNIEIEQMGEVARNYYDLAVQDKRVIGILGYFWPNEFDIPGSTGARGMPRNVISEYEIMGKSITKK
ncbi:hypothetical protein [Lewinella sp. W8]|uniref:hypothetical protein n=1 Tax=Lewinella sp. W8 TaxID=2528208 RepID=UPI001067C1BE|nr:hypothetical protein [Lewinella sp. W8]MTB51112.1 hypothetical protein [Lewinella sp. W8]